MQKENLEHVIAQAADKRQRHPIALAVRGSTEVGVVVPSILRAKLEAAGYTIHDDTAALADFGFKSSKVLKRVIVTDRKGTMVAMGAAVDPNEALLAAMLGWFRENPLPGVETPQGFATAPAQP